MPQFGAQNTQMPVNPMMMGGGNSTLSETPSSSSVPSTPQARREALERDFENVKSMDRNVRSKQIINENRLAEMKSKIIRELFAMMENLGVDPNDLESINQFLQMLDQQDPDLRELFELAFNRLTGDGGMGASAESESPMRAESPMRRQGSESGGLMQRFGNLAQNIMQPR